MKMMIDKCHTLKRRRNLLGLMKRKKITMNREETQPYLA
jgi:hypothetical protein